MTDPNRPSDLLPLIESLINGTIDDAGFTKLNSILEQSPEARAFYRRYMNLHAALPELLGRSPRLAFRGAQQTADEVVDWDTSSSDGFLRLIGKLESADEQVAIVDLAEPEKVRSTTRATDNSAFSFQDLSLVGGYLIHKAVTSRVAVFAALAAAVLLAVGLFVVYLDGSDNQPARTASAPQSSDQPDEPVATLTATYDALWSDTTLRLGDPLHPGERLILAEGFAEITTGRGAVAIIQAPATVELLDNDNAIRLHAGKLVGICETPSSQGFVVRTPHMDVTDLGTRFGVAVDAGLGTLAEVFEGAVTVHATGTTGRAFEPAVLNPQDRFELDLFGRPTTRPRFAAGAFDHLELHESGIVSLDGQTRWLSGQLDPADFAAWQDTDHILVFKELSGYRLEHDLALTLHRPGRYEMDFDKDQPSTTLPAGTVIDSYLVLLRSDTREKLTRQGGVRFQGRVLGLVCGSKQWIDFSEARPDLPWNARSLRVSNLGPEIHDELVIHDDGHSIGILLELDGGQDVFRVIIAPNGGGEDR